MKSGSKPPWYLWIPVAACFFGILVPLLYLFIRAGEAETGRLAELVFQKRNFDLLLRTLALALAVVSVSTLIAWPLAWLTIRTDLKFKKVFTLLSLLPLAMPGYVLALSFLALGAPDGPLNEWFGIMPGRLSGFVGSVAALSIYNYPLLFLNLRTGFTTLDQRLSEAARTLGKGRSEVFRRVVLPQLLPSYLAGALLVALYVIGDFGVVSLMRYETFSYAIFLQYTASYDRIYAACLALMLLGVTAGFLALEFRLLRDLELDRVGLQGGGAAKTMRLGRWSPAAYSFLTALLALAVVAPCGVLLYWAAEADSLDLGGLARSSVDSLRVSVPAALAAGALAVPLAYLSGRYGSRAARLMERSVFIGYAMPALALALGIVFFVLRAAPVFYQSALLLVAAYVLHFVALAVGPIRTRLSVASRRLEEAARSLGHGHAATFRRVTLPLLRPGILAAVILVYIACMKELPLTFLLAPLDFQPLALGVYGYTAEALFAEAAPFALTLVLVSALFTGVLVRLSREER